jgi:hypothetical protein
VSRFEQAAETKGTRRRWLWFLTGFAVVFISMSLLITMFTMRSDGAAIQSIKLWEFYLIEIPRLFSFEPRTMGPGSGSSSNLVATAALHLACSAAGGLAAIAAHWILVRFKVVVG